MVKVSDDTKKLLQLLLIDIFDTKCKAIDNRQYENAVYVDSNSPFVHQQKNSFYNEC